ncbi:SLC13 family permease [Suttonella sp. R2A3]|uniref:SLC13 family permease n=1 Tax=Suttonella sp. R2A3 TaxID=2908648 RepID=UPI001F2386A1|nr:SLC13 family permease [Suttonella sp. R2A3]UJF24326.1 SLC13 family permease [Suttonella sp. R2A3]
MTVDQGIVFLIILASLAMFVWGRLRYDFVALLALLIGAATGVVPAGEVFSGFGHPAVITVAAVLVLSYAASSAGVVDVLARLVTKVGDNLLVQIFTLTSLVAVCSAFMNNVGALALIMPVAIWLARKSERSPSLLLMPIAFGSLLGGMQTMIGTPPNIIITGFMQQATGEPFAMFDFTPVGVAATVVGVVFISLIGWRLIPQRSEVSSEEDLFKIESYLTEVVLPEGCDYDDRTLHDLIKAVEDEADISVVALIRGNIRRPLPSTFEVLHEGDILMVEASPESLNTLITVTGVVLAEQVPHEEDEAAKRAQVKMAEVIVTPDSLLVGSSLTRLGVREVYGMNVLAVARRGQRLRQRLSRIRFIQGDILLVQGRANRLPNTLRELGCLPLASRSISIGKPQKVALASAIFFIALALTTFGVLSAAVALSAAAVTMVLTRIIQPGEFYKSIDMPVIVLLAAMLPVGMALQSTGGSDLIAQGILSVAGHLSPAMMLVVLMSAIMLLTNVINNAAAVILAAPIALKLAEGMNYQPEALLMGVAVASSSAFLTPIGHQSNTLVMSPGGYQFGDYWRMGLPLSLLVMLVTIPVILWQFPV